MRLVPSLGFIPCLLFVGAADAAPILDAPALSGRIDTLIEARLAKKGVKPAPVADDAEFFRRLSLDLNGRIPSLAQLSDFLDDARPDKRRLWTDELLDGRDNVPLSINHFTNVWRRRLLANTPAAQALGVVEPLEAWLRRQVQAGTPYDRMVRGLLTDPGAAAFLRANENKPENLASATARLFLGVKLECAQCHDDRSGGNWKRRQFWEFAAFFASPRQKGEPPRLRIGAKDQWAEARFLDGVRPNWKDGAAPQAVLTNWIARTDNPWFARAAVNVQWRDLFGVGLMDPVDGFGVKDNPPSHPELLDELAEQFARHDFDTKYLLRAIVGSRTYQRTSRQTDPGQRDARLFARAGVRSLTGEQLRDSVLAATGFRPRLEDRALRRLRQIQAEFVALFEGGASSPLESPASMQQALAVMNGPFIEEVTNPASNPVVAALIGGRSSRPVARRITDLYLLTLSRQPRPEELARMVKHVEEGDSKRAMRGVLWALLNSTEFVVNH